MPLGEVRKVEQQPQPARYSPQVMCRMATFLYSMVRTSRGCVRTRLASTPQCGHGAFFGAQKIGIVMTVGALASMPAFLLEKLCLLFLERRLYFSTPQAVTHWRWARSVTILRIHARSSR